MSAGNGFSKFEIDRWNPARFGRACLDRDSNLIERGMAASFEGRIYVVGYAARSMYERSPLICLDGKGADGRAERVMLSGLFLRSIHVLGYRLPLVHE